MFQLVCDPSGVVVETTIKELVPALLSWANRLDNMLRVLMSNILTSAQVNIYCETHYLFHTKSCPITMFLTQFIFSDVHLFQGLKDLLNHISVYWVKESVGLLMFYCDCWQKCFHFCTKKRLKLAHFLLPQMLQEHCFPLPCLNCMQGMPHFESSQVDVSFLI